MPLIDLKCSNDDCAHVVDYYRALATWDAPLPACELCGASTYQSLDQSHRRAHIAPDAVVVYQAPDGTFRFPGDGNGLSAANYSRQGFTRLELRGAADVRRFESTMNAQEYSRAQRHTERLLEVRERQEAVRRSEVRRGLEQGYRIPEQDAEGRPTGRMTTVRMSERGRSIMQTAMRHNDGKPLPRAREAGFFVDAYSNDRSNREASRDERGRRRRD